MSPIGVHRGELWWVDFGIPVGHEQGGRRPALVLSVDAFNRGLTELVIVLPLTSQARHVVSHIEILPPEGGLSQRSFVKCEDIRSISQLRLANRIGTVSSTTMNIVEDRLRMLTGL